MYKTNISSVYSLVLFHGELTLWTKMGKPVCEIQKITGKQLTSTKTTLHPLTVLDFSVLFLELFSIYRTYFLTKYLGQSLVKLFVCSIMHVRVSRYLERVKYKKKIAGN